MQSFRPPCMSLRIQAAARQDYSACEALDSRLQASAFRMRAATELGKPTALVEGSARDRGQQVPI